MKIRPRKKSVGDLEAEAVRLIQKTIDIKNTYRRLDQVTKLLRERVRMGAKLKRIEIIDKFSGEATAYKAVCFKRWELKVKS